MTFAAPNQHQWAERRARPGGASVGDIAQAVDATTLPGNDAEQDTPVTRRGGFRPEAGERPPKASGLSSLLIYDSQTGDIRWRVRASSRPAGSIAGCPSSDGYWQIKINGRVCAGHRVAWALHYGEWPASLLDHINGNRQDNRIANLRLATKAQNAWNRPGWGVLPKGVVRTRSNTFYATIKPNGGKRIRLGTFATAEEAGRAYLAAAELHYGEFARAL